MAPDQNHVEIVRNSAVAAATASPARQRVLFMAEAVTLAHIARPLALAAVLDPQRYDVVLACDPRVDWATAGFRGRVLPIRSTPSQQFLRALALGRPVYDAPTLEAYVEEDLEVLRRVEPDVVVGDFRLSLSVSARRVGVPYVALSNAYWSPYYTQARYVAPEHPTTRFLPVAVASAFFRSARPIFFALHAQPLNRVRKRFGLSSLGGDLRRIYTDADWVLYADIPELFPLADPPPTHRFLGPLIWAPPVERPTWWNELPPDRPIIYVTLGSSGRPELLQRVLEGLASLDVTVIAAAASDGSLVSAPANARVAKYLPGDEAARRAALVICNGGSPTSQQALGAGVPVIGIASNLDQFLNMQAIERLGAGALVRADRFGAGSLRVLAERMRDEEHYREMACQVRSWFATRPAAKHFRELLSDLRSRSVGSVTP